VARLVYSAITSLDGYVEDASGRFDWAAPDEEVHAFVNQLERPIGTYLYGRRMYETMAAWDSPQSLPVRTPATDEFATIWRAAQKVVFSRTLARARTERTRIEREFDPSAIAELGRAGGGDLSIGGANLAGQALAAGLVDELQLIVVPVAVGGGKPALPRDVRLDLGLLDVRRFASGVVATRYAVRAARPGGYA
jgi:dihydrofolate reductase